MERAWRNSWTRIPLEVPLCVFIYFYMYIDILVILNMYMLEFTKIGGWFAYRAWRGLACLAYLISQEVPSMRFVYIQVYHYVCENMYL